MRGKQNKQAGHSPHLSEVSVPSVLPASFLLSEPLSRELLTFQQTAFGKTSGKPNLPGSLRPVSKVSVGVPRQVPRWQNACVCGGATSQLWVGAAETLVTLQLTFLRNHMVPTGRDSCRQSKPALFPGWQPLSIQALLSSWCCFALPEGSGQPILWIQHHEGLEAASQPRSFPE